MNRRQFLSTSVVAAISAKAAAATASQKFTAGVVPAGKYSASNPVDSYWAHCDQVAKLGFHHIEINNTRTQIAEYYANRTSEFKASMGERGLVMTGLALFSNAANKGETNRLLDKHTHLGRFLSHVGGKYITHMIALGELLNEPKNENAYQQVDLKSWADNANRIGKALIQEWGIKLAYHPEQGEIRNGLYKRFLDTTDERFVYFLPDIGHIVSGGGDAVLICRTYRQRLAGVHLKDFSGSVAANVPLKAGNVSFGRGIAKLEDVVAELKSEQFSGYVMAESGGTNQQMRDYMVQSLGITI